MTHELEELCTNENEPKPEHRYTLEDFPTPLLLEERIRAMRIKRQRLGMQYRAYVLDSFSMKRYITEHTLSLYIADEKRAERLLQAKLVRDGVLRMSRPRIELMQPVALSIGMNGECLLSEEELRLADVYEHRDTQLTPAALRARHLALLMALESEREKLMNDIEQADEEGRDGGTGCTALPTRTCT